MRYVSLFSGIEAASCAWGPLGWEPLAFAEIEPFPCAVLAHRYPGVTNLGDVTTIDWDGFKEEHGAVDIVVGGSPCQSFSVAGRREGLEGASGLMWEYVRCVREVVPEWVVWENVPGALSSTGGEDFGCLLRELDGLGYGLAWRVLDAQWFGLAQRRKRLFLVGHLGDMRSCDVLFEQESLRWDTPTGEQKRQALAAAAGKGAAYAGFKWHASPAAGNIGFADELSSTIQTDKPPAVLGFCPGASRTASNVAEAEELSPTLRAGDSHTNIPAVAFCQNSRDEIAGTLTARHDSSPCPDRGQNVVAVDFRHGTCGDPCEPAGTLQAKSTGGYSLNYQPGVLCVADDAANAAVDEELSGTLTAHHAQPKVASGTVVRRLTPLECERLMGFPDGWTDVPYKGRDHPPDGPRYKAIGNSMAVPCMKWIGEKIDVSGKRGAQ